MYNMIKQATRLRPPLRTRALRTVGKFCSLALLLAACKVGPMSEGPQDAGTDSGTRNVVSYSDTRKKPKTSSSSLDYDIEFADSNEEGIPVHTDADGSSLYKPNDNDGGTKDAGSDQ